MRASATCCALSISGKGSLKATSACASSRSPSRRPSVRVRWRICTWTSRFVCSISTSSVQRTSTFESGRFSGRRATSFLRNSVDRALGMGLSTLRGVARDELVAAAPGPVDCVGSRAGHSSSGRPKRRRCSCACTTFIAQRGGARRGPQTAPATSLWAGRSWSIRMPRPSAELPRNGSPVGCTTAWTVRKVEGSRRPTADRWDWLTESEQRVAGCVVDGMTNRQIADVLVLSRHTVDAHLKHMFVKLDIHSRVELTVMALRHSSHL